MSDELDPSLLRLFAQANEPLPGRDFQAQVTARLHRSWSWPEIAAAFGFATRAALLGIAAGIVAPLKLRSGYVGAMAASAAGLTVWIALHAP